MSSLEGPNPFAQTWRNQLAATNPQGSVDLVWSEPVAHIVINRPEKRNAVSLAMWKAIPYLISEISTNPRASVVIVKGAGTEAFAAGADITELEACMGSDERGAAYMDAVENAESALASCGLPVIAAIKGFCIGAGLEIAMACDLRMATDDSTFAAPPAKLGANYSHSSTRRLTELVGVAIRASMRCTGTAEVFGLGDKSMATWHERIRLAALWDGRNLYARIVEPKLPLNV